MFTVRLVNVAESSLWGGGDVLLSLVAVVAAHHGLQCCGDADDDELQL